MGVQFGVHLEKLPRRVHKLTKQKKKGHKQIKFITVHFAAALLFFYAVAIEGFYSH